MYADHSFSTENGMHCIEYNTEYRQDSHKSDANAGKIRSIDGSERRITFWIGGVIDTRRSCGPCCGGGLRIRIVLVGYSVFYCVFNCRMFWLFDALCSALFLWIELLQFSYTLNSQCLTHWNSIWFSPPVGNTLPSVPLSCGSNVVIR